MPQIWPYSRLPPSDPEIASTSKKKLSIRLRARCPRLKVVVITLFSLLLVSFLYNFIKKMFEPKRPFSFGSDRRPAWLSKDPVGGPLALRVAVITAPNEFEKREAIRDTIFRGVREADVKLEYRFFVGSPSRDLEEEEKIHKDMIILDIPDIRERISEKRYAALKWAGSAQRDTYDYFMTMDTDTFVRFGALAKRLPVFLWWRRVQPRKQPVLIGRMMPDRRYYLNTVADGNENALEHDEVMDGPKYWYPAGIAYMLSSFLVNSLLSTNPPLAHHVHYPYDDVMVGAWIASLKKYHDRYARFASHVQQKNETGRPMYPKPLLPKPVDTVILDDVEGWHDFFNRGGHDASFSWSSVCVHHVGPEDMREFRAMEEISGEWDQ